MAPRAPKLTSSASVGSDLGFGFGHLSDHSLLTSRPATAAGHPVACCSPRAADGLRRCRADAEPPGHQQVVGCVDVAPQPRPCAGQFDGPRMSMALRRIRSELRIESYAESKQRRRARAVPVADEAARVSACGGDRLGQLLGLQRWQITLQRNDIGCLFAYRGFGGGDCVVQRIAVTLRGRVRSARVRRTGGWRRRQPHRG